MGRFVWTTTGICLLISLSALPPLVAQSVGVSKEEAKKLKNPITSTPESIAEGRQVYTRSCRNCHGPAGKGEGMAFEGGPEPANFQDKTFQRSKTDGELFVSIRDGVPPDFYMEAWGDRLKETDIWNAVNYVRTLEVK